MPGWKQKAGAGASPDRLSALGDGEHLIDANAVAIDLYALKTAGSVGREVKDYESSASRPEWHTVPTGWK